MLMHILLVHEDFISKHLYVMYILIASLLSIIPIAPIACTLLYIDYLDYQIIHLKSTDFADHESSFQFHASDKDVGVKSKLFWTIIFALALKKKIKYWRT